MRYKVLAVAFSAVFLIGTAQAQNAGTVTNHAFAIGKGAGVTGYSSALCTSAQLIVGQSAADPLCKTITGDITISAAGATAIGANKVVNSMLAAVSANTVKGATGAGTPTDLALPSCSSASNALIWTSGSGFGCNSFASTPANPTGSVGLTAVNGAASTFMRSDAAPALSQAIAPTWTGTHTFNNVTYSALFTNPAGFGGQTTPSAPIHVGAASMLSSGSNILSARVNTGSANVHGIAENSTYNLGASALGVAAYDAISTFTGTQTYDHTVSYQSRPTYGSSGTITNIYGSWDQPTVNTGTATNRYGHYVSDAIGTGTVTNNYGYYTESMTKGGTLNYAFYSAGTTPSKLGGNVDVGSMSVAGTDATGVWTSYTPSVAAQTGTFTTTSATGRYKQIGKTVCFSLQATMTTIGTASGYVILGLPVAAKQTTSPGIAFSGIRSGLVGLTSIIDTTSTIDVVDASAGASPISAGRSLYITGCYEAT